jgi:hypothetical protein
VGEGGMPAPGPISRDAIGLHTRWHGAAAAEADPPDLGHPHLPVTPVELFDLAWLEPDLAETFVYPPPCARTGGHGCR